VFCFAIVGGLGGFWELGLVVNISLVVIVLFFRKVGNFE
jgi:hypothetical protein